MILKNPQLPPPLPTTTITRVSEYVCVGGGGGAHYGKFERAIPKYNAIVDAPLVTKTEICAWLTCEVCRNESKFILNFEHVATLLKSLEMRTFI